jgi:hypothetical protein
MYELVGCAASHANDYSYLDSGDTYCRRKAIIVGCDFEQQLSSKML